MFLNTCNSSSDGGMSLRWTIQARMTTCWRARGVRSTQESACHLIGIVAGLWLMTMSLAQANDNAPIDFARDIRPILSDKCFACHGPDEEAREADLRLDDEASAKAERDEGAAIVPGKPEASLLWQRLHESDPDLRMPPAEVGKDLTEQERAKIRRWIEQGAPWARHWAYVPPVHHPTPKVADHDWPVNFIDAFLLARMESAGVEPAPLADDNTLLRRLSFDLRGLPPTAEELAEFRADRRPDRWSRWIDRFLASSAYGERMAIYWLDLVRYADTVGYHGDQEHSISPYRDWVIDALNDDMPFDEFTRYQIAGDLLPDATLESVIASAYNRLLQTSHEGGVQAKEYLAIYSADHVRNLSAVWLGATMGCAQCHDHKYDPFTMKDFYSMAAFFADLDEGRHLGHGVDRERTVREPEIVVLSRRERAELGRLRKEWQALVGDASPEATERCRQLEDAMRRIEARARRLMISVSTIPRTIRLLPRGNWLDDSGPVMQPEVPEFLGKLNVTGRATRLDLANWLVDPHDGVGLLTARVMANRLWYLFFGEGLARKLDDFGGQGEPPDHPELLDRLALELVANGWRLKPTIKRILESRAYRLESRATRQQRDVDPENRLFAHQNAFRLPAEMIRDQMLAVSGLLVEEVGGPSACPYQPAGYYRHLNFPKRKYRPDRGPSQWRRGVYVHWQRQYLHPMLKAFDAPSREECTAQRPRSNTPLAALVLLNDPSAVEAARVFAARILRESPSSNDAARVQWAAERVFSRSLEPQEVEALLEVLEGARSEFAADSKKAEALLRVGIARVGAPAPAAEWASWTEVARAMFNAGAAVTRY